jgi:uncharacterized protein
MTGGSTNPIPHKQIHPGYQFLVLIGLLLAALIFGQMIAGAIITARYGIDTLIDLSKLNVSTPQVQDSLWILQFVGTTMPILVTPIIFSYFIVRDPDSYMKNNFHFPWLFILLVFLIMMLAFPLIEFIESISQKFPLPQWMRDFDQENKKASDSMLQMNSILNMIFDLLFIGLLTAVIEEILFRGCMQTIFIRWMKNKHAAVWTTAILFSAFHMEFSGFLSRLFLGVLFGYFTVWSGSIWPAIWGHFVNNGTIVVITYLSQHKLIGIGPDDQQVFNGVWYIISAVITLFLLLIYRNISSKRQIADIHGEELG